MKILPMYNAYLENSKTIRLTILFNMNTIYNNLKFQQNGYN